MIKSSDLTNWLRELPADLRIIHDFGNANAPDAIAGRHRLVLAPDGGVELEWWDGDRYGRWTARVPAALVRRFADLLIEAKFPDFPRLPLRPGPSFRVFALQRGSESSQAIMARNPLEGQPPFEELSITADSLCAQIRGEIPGMYNDIPPAISDVQPA